MSDTEARLTVAHAEIERLRGGNQDLAALLREQGCEMLDMRDRITALEAALAIARGTVAQPEPPDEPATVVHNVPPDAPR